MSIIPGSNALKCPGTEFVPVTDERDVERFKNVNRATLIYTETALLFSEYRHMSSQSAL